MLKRTSTLDLSPDQRNIILGDKFGDVYSLPLLQTEGRMPKATNDLDKPPKRLAASANTTTVHSKANLRILELQQKQIERGDVEQTAKQSMEFEHELLLGHVSMVTDMVVGEEVIDGKSRHFLLTADRDEHIRVSRSPPQSYVVERFLLGHREFINKLCVLGGNMLISGGGDNELYVWDWCRGILLCKIDLQNAVAMALSNGSKDESTTHIPGASITVTGIWTLPSRPAILVACEGVPALFHTELIQEDGIVCHSKVSTFKFMGNVVDVAVLSQRIVVSIDPAVNASTETSTTGGDVSILHT